MFVALQLIRENVNINIKQNTQILKVFSAISTLFRKCMNHTILYITNKQQVYRK